MLRRHLLGIVPSQICKPIFERIERALAPEDRAAYGERLAAFLAPESLAGAEDSELALLTDWFGWYFLHAMKTAIPRKSESFERGRRLALPTTHGRRHADAGSGRFHPS